MPSIPKKKFQGQGCVSLVNSQCSVKRTVIGDCCSPVLESFYYSEYIVLYSYNVVRNDERDMLSERMPVMAGKCTIGHMRKR